MQVGGIGQHYVLALYPAAPGIAYVLFESPLSLVDWGMSSAKGADKNEQCLAHVKKLVDQYVPDVIVIEDTDLKGSRRDKRIRALYRSIQTFAGLSNIDVARFGRAKMLATFAHIGAETKHARSQAVAEWLPDLSHRLPRERKGWMSEDYRTALFEAASLGLTFYRQQ